MFTIEVMDKLDLNLALNGDETELTKVRIRLLFEFFRKLP